MFVIKERFYAHPVFIPDRVASSGPYNFDFIGSNKVDSLKEIPT
jgi:hypothetical protein